MSVNADLMGGREAQRLLLLFYYTYKHTIVQYNTYVHASGD